MTIEINASLQQQGRIGPVRHFQIVNGKEIRICIGDKLKQKIYSVHLLALADKGYFRIHISWPWLILSSICCLALLGYHFTKSISTPNLGSYEFSLIAGLILTGLLSFIVFILKISRKRVFVSRYARVHLFEILINKPDARRYKIFIDAISEHLQTARGFWELKPEHQIAGEMRMLRRLAKQGIIQQTVYEKAKDKLFLLSDENPDN